MFVVLGFKEVNKHAYDIRTVKYRSQLINSKKFFAAFGFDSIDEHIINSSMHIMFAFTHMNLEIDHAWRASIEL